MTVEQRTNQKALSALNKLVAHNPRSYQNCVVMERNLNLENIAWQLGRGHIWTPELTRIEKENRGNN